MKLDYTSDMGVFPGFFKEAGSMSPMRKAEIGPIKLSVSEKEQVNIPTWAGLGVIVLGVVLLAAGGRKR